MKLRALKIGSFFVPYRKVLNKYKKCKNICFFQIFDLSHDFLVRYRVGRLGYPLMPTRSDFGRYRKFFGRKKSDFYFFYFFLNFYLRASYLPIPRISPLYS